MVTLKECFPFAVNIVSFNPCVGISSRVKIYFLLSSACLDELLSTKKTDQNRKLGLEKVKVNPTQYHIQSDNIYQDEHLKILKNG